jgi:predicted SAM-dependent methyltransferase
MEAEWHIYYTGNEPSWQRAAKFEIRSLITRAFFGRPPRTARPRLLHLGCGKNRLTGFTNADLFRLRGGVKPDWCADLRHPLRCPDDFWDGVFSEHVLEHLAPRRARNLLSELKRTTRDGGIIRIVVPDLRLYTEHYLGRNSPPGFEMWETPAEGLRSVSQNWHHRSLWDFDLLSKVARDAGFAEIRKVSFGQGEDPRLIQDQPHRAWESLYVELVA